MNIRRLFAVIASFGIASASAAASPPAMQSALGDPIFHAVADARSIPENVVSTIAQDRAGFLWIGTPDGVVRYDGYVYRAFRHIAGDPTSLAENHVRQIFGARDGRVWIATGAGVSVFDPATERFAQIEDALRGDSVYAFADGDQGRVFVGGHRGLYSVDERTLAVQRIDAMPRGGGRPERDKVIALLRDRRGDLWIGSVDGLAVRGADGVVEAVELPAAEQPEQQIQPVDRLFEAHDGAIWISRVGGRIARVDPATRAVRPLEGAQRTRSYALAQIDPDTIWIGTASTGIEVRDAATGALRGRHRHDGSVPESLVSDHVRSLFVDRSGVLWIGTSGKGLARYNPADDAFRLLRYSPLRADGLRDEDVRALYESSDGLLWVASHDQGVDVFDGTRRVASYQAGDAPDTLDAGTVRSVVETADGAIWIGTYGWLNRLDRSSGRIERLHVEPFGSASMRVHHLVQTPDGAGLWVGTTAGLAYLDLARREWSLAAFDDGRPVRHDVTDAAYGPDGTLWIATTSRMAALPPGATAFVELSHAANTDGTLPAGSPLSLLFDREDRMWLGMSTGLVRLLRFDGRTARFESIAPKLGLANRRCDNLNQDAAGGIWIEEKARFDPATFAIRHFGVDEGAGRSIWHGVSLRTRAGRILLGATEGLFVIDPERLRAWDYAPPIVLTALHVDGAARAAAAATPLVLAPNTASVGFEFAALDLSAPARNRYAYRLRGFDRGWTEIDGGHRSAAYTALPPGDYTFEVRGTNREGQWSPHALALPVQQLPAFYQTAWFKAAAAVLLIGLTWPLYLMRLRVLAARQHELEHTVARRTLELQLSEQRAQEASQAKSVFLANMSHELRTPLNAVLGFARLLRRSAVLGQAERDNLAIIERSGEHLLALINQVLSIAKIESGRMTLDVQPFDPHVALDTIAKMIRHRAEQAELAFDVDIDPALPHAVRGDAGKLRQALLNLLSNAVKFTREGGVALRVRWDGGRAWFEIADTGPGIAADELPLLFEPFAQTATGRAAQEGTGLGLAITRRIVELMGGTLAVDSTPGVGTTFRFDAVFEPCDAVPAASDAPDVLRLAAPLPAPRIAVVDDTAENRALLVDLLHAVGFEVRSVVNGAEGVALWRDWQPALIFMDLRMPVLDGHGAIRRIRAEEAARDVPPVRVVALTASVFEAEAGGLRDEGFDDVIFKPYRESAIFGALERLLGVQFEYCAAADAAVAARPVPAAAVAATGSKGRVLLADDDWIGRTVAQNALQDAGFDVIESSDGQEALEILDGADAIDLVLLDVEMPRLGGVATVRRIRAAERLRHLPVLALTAHDDPADLARLIDAGMDAHVVKPFEPEQLAHAVTEWIGRARARHP